MSLGFIQKGKDSRAEIGKFYDIAKMSVIVRISVFRSCVIPIFVPEARNFFECYVKRRLIHGFFIWYGLNVTFVMSEAVVMILNTFKISFFINVSIK